MIQGLTAHSQTLQLIARYRGGALETEWDKVWGPPTWTSLRVLRLEPRPVSLVDLAPPVSDRVGVNGTAAATLALPGERR